MVRIVVEMGEQASYLQVRKGEADLDLYSLPTASHAQLTKEFGINKGRYFVHPSNSIGYFALNTSRGFFKDPKARQAVGVRDQPSRDHASRRAQRRHAERADPAAGHPQASGNAPIYPLDQAERREGEGAARREDGEGRHVHANDPLGINTGQMLQANLKAIGIDVQVKPLHLRCPDRQVRVRVASPFDITSIGWFADYPDPYDFINILLDGRTIAAKNNVNVSYFDNPTYQKRMDAAAKLAATRGTALRHPRHRHHAQPVTARHHNNQNVREFISSKIGCPTTRSPGAGSTS